MRVILFILFAAFAAQTAGAQTGSVIAPSYKFPQVRPPVHKVDQSVPLNLQTLRYHPADIAKVTLAIYTDQGGNTPMTSWDLGPRDQVIFFERLALLELPSVTTPDDYAVPRKYTSMELTFHRRDGRKTPRLAVFKNTAVIEGDRQIWIDPENKLEKWLFSTATRFEDRVFANTALNVQTFRDCAWAGNLVVDTANPNQCILPDGTLFLRVDPDDLPADPKLTNYATCYKAKRPVLDEFPRKCVLPGGRVVIEPARLKEDVPAPVKKQPKPKPVPKAATPVVDVPVPAAAAVSSPVEVPGAEKTLPTSDVPAPLEAKPAPAVKKQDGKAPKAKTQKPAATKDDTPAVKKQAAPDTTLPAVDVSANSLQVVAPARPAAE